MEENNNDEKTILDKGKDAVKKQTDKFASKMFKKILIKILPFIGGFFLILLLAGLILAIPTIISQTWKDLLGSANDAVANATSVYSSDFLEAAQQVHDEEMDWIYYTEHRLGLKSLASPVTQALINKNQTTYCATYVSCVLYASGYFKSEEFGTGLHSAAGVDELLDKNGWEKITEKENLQAGDIVICCDATGEIAHVQIYAGDNKWYTAGSTSDIQAPAPKQGDDNWDAEWPIWWAYRLPASGPTNPPAERKLGQLIHIDKNGAYKYNTKDLPEQILEKLQNQKVNNELMGFAEELNGSESSDEQVSEKVLKKLIERYIEVEVQTTFPETECLGNEVDGIIKIKRASSITGEYQQDLKYVSAEEFDKMLGRGDGEIYNCFSIDPVTYELWIARRGSSTTHYDFDNAVIRSVATERFMVKDVIDYQELIQNYSVPFNFLLTLHLISQDVDFMKDFLDMVVENKKEEPIVLTYLDTYLEDSVQYDYEGNDITTTRELNNDEFPVRDYANPTEDKIPKEEIKKIDNTNIHKYINDIKYHRRVSITSFGKLYVTKADSWFKTAEKKIGKFTSNPEPNVIKSIKVNKEKTPEKIGENLQSEGKIMIWETVTTKQSGTRYTEVNSESKINVKKFIDLIKKYPNVENNFKSAPSNIFYLLQQNENTQKIERVMRYVMLELNDVNYGITLTQLEYLLDDETRFYSTSQLLRDYIRYWEYPVAPPTNEDNTCYIIEKDEQGKLVVGYGVKIEEYMPLFTENNYPTEVGGEVPVEFVDSLEKQTIQAKLEEVSAYTDGLNLKTYQKYALVSRAYSCGILGAIEVERGVNRFDFKEACTEYWNQETDSKFKEKDKNADFTHKLYTEYVAQPSEGKRRESEWTLFQCGYYDVLFQWHTSGDDIIVVADEIHKYMEKHQYTYCVHEPDGSRGDECLSMGIPCRRLRTTFEKSKSSRATCCATYVSWVLQETKFITEEEHKKYNGDGARSLVNLLRSKGWTEIESYDELEPGDVLYYTSDGFSICHVDIYAGDNGKYNAGGGGPIRGASPSKMNPADFHGALRAP